MLRLNHNARVLLPLLLSLAACDGKRSDIDRDQAAVHPDSVLVRSHGLVVLLKGPNYGRIEVFRGTAASGSPAYYLDSLPATPELQVDSLPNGRRVLLWTLDHEEFLGGSLVVITQDTFKVLYSGWSPNRQVCAVPTMERIGGRLRLVEEQAAVVGVESCTDVMDRCARQFTTTWPEVFDLYSDSVSRSASGVGEFYASRERLYRAWRDSIANGARVRGSQIDSSTLREACGPGVLDSLESLARRAQARVN